MSDDTMVERVAKAIQKAHHDYHPTMSEYREMARAAIAAMREPTPEILAAGPDEPYMDAYVWGKMIDAALK